LMARLVNTLDHVTEGRIGWNCVTSSNDGAAENYGSDGQRPHDERYDVADEFADVVTRLWEAWEPDAVVLDRANHRFADGAKVHAIHHDGKYFRVRGPLNAPRSPQGRVPICQAGGSPRGQAFAARWADTIITNSTTVEGMKKFRAEVRRLAGGFRRGPDSIKVLYLCYPPVRITHQAARRRRPPPSEQDGQHLDLNLSGLSRLTNIDFAKFDLDQPLPEGLTTNGHQSSLTSWIGKTPRELAIGSRRQGYELVGSIDSVASHMEEI